MIKEITPDYLGDLSIKVFIGGTIDNGLSKNWQSDLISDLKATFHNKVVGELILYNPRVSRWHPDATEKDIEKQIIWELDKLTKSDIVVLNFEPESKSPITLLELGLFVNNKYTENQTLIVRCPKEFYRYTNVVTTLKYFNSNVILVESFTDLVDAIVKNISDRTETFLGF